MSTIPWYASGLRFRCQRCGSCCTGAPGYVWLEFEEAAAIAARFGMEPDAFVTRYARRVFGKLSLREEDGGRCVLYEPGSGCRAYEDRPRQCRTWPFWARIIATPAAWEREAVDCPGMDKGELVDPAEIERLASPPDR
jgi:hypothetical protein